MKILVCVSEYPPRASGIGNLAYHMVEEFTRMGHNCIVCSPSGPDIRLGSHSLIQRFGALGIMYFWQRVSRYFRNKQGWDATWLHSPLFLGKCPFTGAIITVHTTYQGFRAMTRELGGSLFLKTYYALMEPLERFCLGHIVNGGHCFTGVSPHVTTGAMGRASTLVKLGSETGVYRVQAEVSDPQRGLSLRSISFSIMAVNPRLMVFAMLGGLAIFIFGIRRMSEGLQHVAGRRLRAVLELFTRNRLVAIFVGAGVTALM